MAKLAIQKASTDVSVYVFIQDSSSTTGGGLTGLVYNTASLVCYYVRPLAAAAALALATQTVAGAHSDGGFVEVDATNMPGIYRLDLSDAIVATGVNSVVLMLKGAANMAPLTLEIELVAYNPQDAVRLGLTALPNAAAEAAGGLYTRGTGAGQINQTASGSIDANSVAISGDTVAADNLEAACDGNTYNLGGGAVVAASVTGAVGSVTGNVGGNVTGSVGSVAAGGITATSFGAGAIDAASLAADALTSIADAILKRDMSAVVGAASRSLLNAIRFLRNKWSISGTTLTVTAEDDVTTAWTATLTTSASAEPITSSDPA